MCPVPARPACHPRRVPSAFPRHPLSRHVATGTTRHGNAYELCRSLGPHLSRIGAIVAARPVCDLIVPHARARTPAHFAAQQGPVGCLRALRECLSSMIQSNLLCVCPRLSLTLTPVCVEPLHALDMPTARRYCPCHIAPWTPRGVVPLTPMVPALVPRMYLGSRSSTNRTGMGSESPSPVPPSATPTASASPEMCASADPTQGA